MTLYTKKKFLTVALTFSTCCLFAPLSLADSQQDCLDLHVIHNEPLGYLDENNDTKGVHWDYLTLLQDVSGICINKKLVPYPRVWQSIEKGDHDGGIIFKSESRSDLVEYAVKIRSAITVIVPVKSIKLESYNDLEGLVIGKTRGTHLANHFDSDMDLIIVELNNYEQAAKMIKHGRIDAVAGSSLALSYQFNKHDVFDYVNLKEKLVLGEKEQWLQLSKTSPHLDKIPQLKQAIEDLLDDGTFSSIMDQYHGTHWRQINSKE